MAVRQRVDKECRALIEDGRGGPFSWDGRTKLREEMDATMNIRNLDDRR